MDDNNLSIEGFSVERKDRCDGRTGGGFACYIRNSFMYKRLSNLDENELEVIWLNIMLKKIPRKFSCILVACIYFTQMTEYAKMRDHLIACVDSAIRKHLECGVIITGDFNQMNDSFLKTHYKFSQIVNDQGASNTRQNMDKYEYGVFQASNSGRIGNLRSQYGLTKTIEKKDSRYWQFDTYFCKEYGCEGKGNI